MEARTSTKERVSVTEMAALCRLSRSRFQQLVGSAFPYPLYDISNRRPFYDREGQQICLQVRERNMGIDGQPIMFYSTRSTRRAKGRTTRRKISQEVSQVIDGLKALGVPAAKPDQVKVAMKTLFPSGTTGMDDGEILRQVFIFLVERGTN